MWPVGGETEGASGGAFGSASDGDCGRATDGGGGDSTVGGDREGGVVKVNGAEVGCEGADAAGGREPSGGEWRLWWWSWSSKK